LENGVLQTVEEWRHSLDEVKTLGLPPHLYPAKNWDSLAALSCVLSRTTNDAHVLDAGAELYSVILPWLFLYGYRNLVGVNLSFDRPRRRGPISYIPGDLTRTAFPDETFDAITCLSTIEHGVDLDAYFRETARLLKPGGVLVTSMDYYESPTETWGKTMYGAPIHIFSRSEVEEMLPIGRRYGFDLTGPLSLRCADRAVHWELHGLRYTFLMLTMQKGE